MLALMSIKVEQIDGRGNMMYVSHYAYNLSIYP